MKQIDLTEFPQKVIDALEVLNMHATSSRDAAMWVEAYIDSRRGHENSHTRHAGYQLMAAFAGAKARTDAEKTHPEGYEHRATVPYSGGLPRGHVTLGHPITGVITVNDPVEDSTAS